MSTDAACLFTPLPRAALLLRDIAGCDGRNLAVTR